MTSEHEFLAGNQRGGGYVKDFSVVAKGASPEGSTIHNLVGFAESGVIAACRAAADASLLDTMEGSLQIDRFRTRATSLGCLALKESQTRSSL